MAEAHPVSVFMAGSPGADKTEASLAWLLKFGEGSAIRIDPDELRAEFPAYDRRNAWLAKGGIGASGQDARLRLEPEPEFFA